MKISDHSWTWCGFERIYLAADSLLDLPYMIILHWTVKFSYSWYLSDVPSILMSHFHHFISLQTVHCTHSAGGYESPREKKNSYMYNEYCLHFHSQALLFLLNSENESNAYRLSLSRSDNLGHSSGNWAITANHRNTIWYESTLAVNGSIFSDWWQMLNLIKTEQRTTCKIFSHWLHHQYVMSFISKLKTMSTVWIMI